MDRREEQLRDEVAILAYQAGDVKALEELARRWQKRLFAYVAMTIGSDEAAWDVSQQVWLWIVNGLARRTQIACFAAWAYGIAHNCCVNHFRDRGRARELELDEAPAARAEAAGEADVDMVDARDAALVRRCIAELPAAHREAITLFYLERLSTEEMAQALNVPAGTVRSRLYYGRRRLREMMLKKGSQYDGGRR